MSHNGLDGYYAKNDHNFFPLMLFVQNWSIVEHLCCLLCEQHE